MQDFSFDTPDSSLGDMNFDSPVPPSYSANESFDSFGSGTGQPMDFNSFGEAPVPQQGGDSFGSFGEPAASGSFTGTPTNDFDFGDSSPAPTGSFDASTPGDNLEMDFASSPTGSFDSPASPIGGSESPLGSFDAPPSASGSQTEVKQPTSAIRMSMPSSGSDALREYEEEHNKFLEEKAQEEREKHQQILEKAKQELQQFYEERQKKIEAAKEENRNKQRSASADVPDDDKAAWKLLADLVDWEAPHGDAASHTERMRGILVDMKHAA